MAYERVQKSFGQSSSKKKHNPIVPPMKDLSTQADTQLSPKANPYKIPSKEERDTIRRNLFENWSNAIQAKQAIVEVEDKYEQSTDNETLARKANPYQPPGNEKKDDYNTQLLGDLSKINETLARTQISPQSILNSSPREKKAFPSKEKRNAIYRQLFGQGTKTEDVQSKTPESSSVAATPIQAKLTIGAPGDKYEQEADRVAAQVVNQINAPVAQQPSQNLQREETSEEDELMMMFETTNIQREAMPEEEEELQMKPMVQLQAGAGSMTATPDLESSIQQARSGGHSLADNIKEPMEQAFGADFSGVKVHTDTQADQLNQSVQARAFTTGLDVFFRQGEYNPENRGGQELIAHELTHVVQQGGGRIKRESLMTSKEKVQRKINYNSSCKILTKNNKEIKSEDDLISALKIIYGPSNEGIIRQTVQQIEKLPVKWTLNNIKDKFGEMQKKREIIAFKGEELRYNPEEIGEPSPLTDLQKATDFAFTQVTALMAEIQSKVTLEGEAKQIKFSCRNDSTRELHAEEILLEQIELAIKNNQIDLKQDPEIKITINNSPCQDKCSKILAKWVLTNNLTNVKIFYANPYNKDMETETQEIMKEAGIKVTAYDPSDNMPLRVLTKLPPKTIDRYKAMYEKAVRFQPY